MPNHVTHRMTLTGPSEEIGRFKQKCLRTEGEGVDAATFFDFNTLIEMPADIRNTESSSVVDNGMYVLEFDSGNSSPLEAMLNWPWVKTAGITSAKELRDKLVADFPNCIEMAQRQKSNLDKYGHSNWYGWSCANWGTKWNSYAFSMTRDEPGEIQIMFDTAWSPPEPIFQKLAEEFPLLRFNVFAFDEGCGFAYEANNEDGEFVSSTLDADDFHYEVVYGEKPEKFDEDEPSKLTDGSKPMTGIFVTLTPEQKTKALNYQGDETIGDFSAASETPQ